MAEKTDPLFIVICTVLLFTILLHLANNFIILRKRRLHKPAYFLLINLSVSDIMLIFVIIGIFIKRGYSLPLQILNKVFVTSSLLSTFGISLDRYISVIHCLRYWEIVTTQRLISFLIISWIISICRRPKKPHLNPKPSASLVSGLNSKDASFNFNFSSA